MKELILRLLSSEVVRNILGNTASILAAYFADMARKIATHYAQEQHGA